MVWTLPNGLAHLVHGDALRRRAQLLAAVRPRIRRCETPVLVMMGVSVVHIGTRDAAAHAARRGTRLFRADQQVMLVRRRREHALTGQTTLGVGRFEAEHRHHCRLVAQVEQSLSKI